MRSPVVFSVLLCGLCVDAATREYAFVNVSMTWTDAQQHCRRFYSDLATVTSPEEALGLDAGSYTGYAWIGLFDDPASWFQVMGSDSNSWRWSVTGATSPNQYQNWNGPIQPDYKILDEKCVQIAYYEKWYDYYCSSRYPFICYNGSRPKEFHLNTTLSTWPEALAYCRTQHTDLAMIKSFTENSAVASLLDSQNNSYAWIGLYRKPWRWSDGTNSTFTNWRNDGVHKKFCATAYTDNLWYAQDCGQMFPFFCNQVISQRSTVKISLSSALDLSDPDNNTVLLQEIEKKLQKAGHTGVKVSWKTPPKKKKKDEL